MSAKKLGGLSILALAIGLSVTTIIGVGIIIDELEAIPATLSILNTINITVFLSALIRGLSYLVGKSGKVSLVAAITIATVLRVIIGVHICLLGAILGLRIVEYGTDSLSEIGLFLLPIFTVAFFILVLSVLSSRISKLGNVKENI